MSKHAACNQGQRLRLEYSQMQLDFTVELFELFVTEFTASIVTWGYYWNQTH